MRNDRRVDVTDLLPRLRRALGGWSGTRWVGIDGCGASGKTTLAARLQAGLPDSVIVHVDDFARPGVPTWERDRFTAQLIQPLAAGRAARYQRWDWATDTGQEWIEVPPGQIAIVEGVSSTDVRLDIDWAFRIWVDTPLEVRLARALARDGAAMMSTWLEQWIPEEDAYVAAQHPQDRADLVVSGSE